MDRLPCLSRVVVVKCDTAAEDCSSHSLCSAVQGRRGMKIHICTPVLFEGMETEGLGVVNFSRDSREGGSASSPCIITGIYNTLGAALRGERCGENTNNPRLWLPTYRGLVGVSKSPE